jgi:hypothetical protein
MKAFAAMPFRADEPRDHQLGIGIERRPRPDVAPPFGLFLRTGVLFLRADDDFAAWLLNLPAGRIGSWPELREAAISELSRLNGRRRSLIQLAGAVPTENDVTSILLTGYIGGVFNRVELDNRSVETTAMGGLAAIGSGKPHARIAYLALRVSLWDG